MIKGIVCIGANGVMGKDGKMPWGDKPLDGEHFRRLTLGHTVVMGRRTFESMGEKPLPGRTTIVLSRSMQRSEPYFNVGQLHSIEDVIILAAAQQNRDIWIIGGAEVFKEAMPYIEEMYVTIVGDAFEGDVVFPDMFSYGRRWESELLGEQDIAIAHSVDFKPFYVQGPAIEDVTAKITRYHLIFRKFTKIRNKNF